jgi:hypothetical protein
VSVFGVTILIEDPSMNRIRREMYFAIYQALADREQQVGLFKWWCPV